MEVYPLQHAPMSAFMDNIVETVVLANWMGV